MDTGSPRPCCRSAFGGPFSARTAPLTFSSKMHSHGHLQHRAVSGQVVVVGRDAGGSDAHQEGRECCKNQHFCERSESARSCRRHLPDCWHAGWRHPAGVGGRQRCTPQPMREFPVETSIHTRQDTLKGYARKNTCFVRETILISCDKFFFVWRNPCTRKLC